MVMCSICGRKPATLYCTTCGEVFCWDCHLRYGKAGTFAGTCAKCGARGAVIKRGTRKG